METKQLRVAAYCRVSTDKDDQANSLISQREYFAGYITQHKNWILNDVYYDEGISGTQTLKRTGFNKMIDEAMRGEIDLILTKEVCRFARNTVDALSFTRKLRDQGVGVIFTIDNIDTRDCDGELRLTLMASLAQEESRKTSERVKWGQKRRMEQGIVFGRDLLGYKVCNGKLEINEEEVPTVRAIFHKYVNEGKGTQVIARELIEEGFKPKRVNEWSNTVILRILRNEKYVGDLCQKKTYTPNYLTHAKKNNRGEEEKVYLANHHEAIIDRDLWIRTQKELARRAPTEIQKKRYSNRYWCSGKIICGLCGQRFIRRTKKYENGGCYKGWRCFAGARHGTKKLNKLGDMEGCDNSSINEKTLLSCMHYCLEQLERNKEKMKKEILREIKSVKDVKAEKTEKVDTTEIEANLKTLKDKRRKTIDLMLDGIYSELGLNDQIKWYDQQIGIFTDLLLKAKSEKPKGLNKLPDYQEYQEYIEALDEIMTFDERNEKLYSDILDKIVVFPDQVVEIWLNCLPFGIKLKTHSEGKCEEYKTKILSMEIVEKSSV